MNQKPTLMAELIAEFLGTFVLILFGIGVVAMVVLFPSKNPGETIHGGFTNITLGWGLAVTMGIYIAGKSFRSASESRCDAGSRRLSRFPLEKGSAVLDRADRRRVCRGRSRLLELPACIPPDRSSTGSPRPACLRRFRHFPDSLRPVSSINSSAPDCCVLLIFAITDEFNAPPGANLAPAMIGLVVVAIGMSFGGMHGYAINPARDFGPRLFTVVAGFRNNGLTDGTHVWWIPIVARLLGGLAGAALYDFGIRRFLRRRQLLAR